ncbi:UNVERIFIED_CONTAM: hypothetical protein GTU68_017898, partial [Idotea baltica]|nr:hypothetical protein [Idotea baltica]
NQKIFIHSEIDGFSLQKEQEYLSWLSKICAHYQLEPECINYIFSDDEYLLNINKEYLQHDFYTDIITFPVSKDPLCVDIFISIERVKDNALTLKIEEAQELKRVMAHGLIHIAGYKDKTEEESKEMREQEELAIALF